MFDASADPKEQGRKLPSLRNGPDSRKNRIRRQAGACGIKIIRGSGKTCRNRNSCRSEEIIGREKVADLLTITAPILGIVIEKDVLEGVYYEQRAKCEFLEVPFRICFEFRASSFEF